LDTHLRYVNNNYFADPIPHDDLSGTSRKEFLNADGIISSLNPVYLPCSLQHTLLVTAQNLLEDSLFKFGRDKMQDVIREKGWDCAQCVELNDWVKILRKRKDLLTNSKGEASDRPLSVVLGSVVQLRHMAVHRQRVTALEVQLFLEDAESLLNFLDDGESAKEISNIHHSLSDHVKDLSAHSSSNQERLRVIAKEKRMQMFQLQVEEHSAVSRVLAESQDIERRATARFQQRMLCREITHARETPSATSFKNDECDHHMEQKSFRFCASCIEDVRTQARVVGETSFAGGSTVTWLSRKLSFADATWTIYRSLTCAARRMLVLAVLVLLVSFGALL
jgi:hypothetical protein